MPIWRQCSPISPSTGCWRAKTEAPGDRGVEPPHLSSVRRRQPPGRAGQSALATTYWMDVTDTEEMRRTLELTRPVVAILMVDNYEDLMKATPEGKRSAVRAMLEEKLSQWSAGSEGMMLKYDRDRYLFVFEEKSFSDFAAKRFDVLDAVREVVAGEGVAATLSIGVGRDADSFEALFKNASVALEMALSRGGDPGSGEGQAEFRVLRRPLQGYGEAHQGEVTGHGQCAGGAHRRGQAGLRHGPQLCGYGRTGRRRRRVRHRPQTWQEVPHRHRYGE